jgi:hypothetical protein
MPDTIKSIIEKYPMLSMLTQYPNFQKVIIEKALIDAYKACEHNMKAHG